MEDKESKDYTIKSTKEIIEYISINDNYNANILNLCGIENILVGCLIKEVNLTHNKEKINFKLEDITLKYNCVGDCCSTSWIESIDDMENMINSKILSIEMLELETIKNHPEYDSLKRLDYLIKTSKGDTRLEFRNSSNGYYGGSLEFVKWVRNE